MCGIVAVRGTSQALPFLLPALARLEYRGYDSAGVAVSAVGGGLTRIRSVGRLVSLEREVSDYRGPALNGTGVGHTRWATHGEVTVANAHPHASCDGDVAVVHNGVIENSGALRRRLCDQGHRFTSDGDSEVVAHMVEDELAHGPGLAGAVRRAVAHLEGTWALAVVQEGTDDVVVTSQGSPLVVGRSDLGVFAASDSAAIAPWVDTVHHLRDGDVVDLCPPWSWWGPDGPRDEPQALAHGWIPDHAELGDHPDFMHKEISEQPATAQAIVDAYAGTIASGALWRSLGLPRATRIDIIACGTSLNAGRVISDVLHRSGLPARATVASEWQAPLERGRTITIAISQSGETADVLGVVARVTGPVVALTNNPNSTLARRADAVLPCVAGPEIGVAATKTFTAQVLAGAALALSAAADAGRIDTDVGERAEEAFASMPGRLAYACARAAKSVRDIVPAFIDAPGALFLGRGSGRWYAAEGELKLQELAYVWARAYPAAELKHGPLALVHTGVPVVAVDDGDPRLRTTLSEVAARGATTIRVGGPGTEVPVLLPHVIPAPWGPLEAVVGLQILAREVAVSLGRDVDKPRNLAKSVTVA